MSSQTDICNYALTLLGQPSINSINDTGKIATTLKGIFDQERDAEIRANIWKFAKRLDTLPALADAPVTGAYQLQYTLPAGCLRVLMLGNSWASIDLSDYRSGPTTDDWSIQDGKILTNWGAPLPIAYMVRITDCTAFDATFARMFSCRLAKTACFRLTNSLNLIPMIDKEYKDNRREALRAGALETPPQMPPDDTWVIARMGDGGAAPITPNG